MKIGFVGLGNVGGKLANNLLENNFQISVLDKNHILMDEFKLKGAKTAKSIKDLVMNSDILITCLPSPKICAEVLESKDGIIDTIQKDQIWIEMSTTEDEQLKKHASLIEQKNAIALEAPVSGGCHRAATGNISIFVGGSREGFDKAMPVLKCLGRKILYAGASEAIVDGVSGFSLNPIETAAWLSRIEDFASNPGKYLKIRKRAQIEIRERFNINQTAGKLIGAFQDIITLIK